MPKHLNLWSRPDCYIGPDWDDHYVVLTQHRDSDSLTRSNFIVAQARLDVEAARLGDAIFDNDGESYLQVTRDHHWAVGWIEFIYLSKHAPHTIVEIADRIVGKIADYPALDEDHWSDLEYTEAAEYWARMAVRERVDAIKESCSGVSVYAARRPELPSDDSGALMEYLRC